MSDEKKRWQADIDREIAEAAESRLEHGDRKELFQKLAEIVANKGLDDRTPYDARIQQLREERRSKIADREEIERDIATLEDEIDILRDKREQYDSQSEKLKGRIEGLEYDLRRGSNMFVGSPMVTEVAEEYEVDEQGIIDRLKHRNPDVPPYAFDKVNDNQFVDNWTGFDEEDVAALPPTEREDLYERSNEHEHLK